MMINLPGKRKTAIPQEELLDLVNLVLPDDNYFILKNRQLENFLPPHQHSLSEY